MLYRKSISVLIVLALVAMCGSPCLAFTAVEGADDSKAEPVTTVYSIGKTHPQTILQVLAKTVPAAVLTIEVEEKRLIAVATPAEHERIVASLKSFEKVVDVTQMDSTRGPLSEDELQITVYATGEKTGLHLLQILQTTVPKAQFTAGEDGKTLIGVALPADHEKICNVLRSLGKKPVDPFSSHNAPELPPLDLVVTGPMSIVPLEPADPEMAKLEQGDAMAGQKVAQIVEEYKAATGEEEQAKVRFKLKQATIEHFVVRQAKRELEVTRLEDRLEKIRQSIATRKELQEQIIERRVAELLGETDDLEF